jgi:hypothetical protein
MTLPGLVRANNLNDVVDRERAWDNLGSSLATGNIAISAPSLDLNFAVNKSLIDDISGNNLITFTRASTGTFVGSNGLIQTAASDVPRFDHNPATGESLGLLVEEARTNLQIYSEQIDNAAWTKNNTTVTANAITAPDSTLTADRLLETATTSSFYVANFGGATATPGTYTASVFAKGDGSGRLLNMTLQQSGVYRQSYFNLSTGTVSNVDVSLTASIQALSNGWYRCSVTGTSSSTTTLFLYSAAAAGDNSVYAVRAGSASAGLFLWGAQLESGTFPTSYIPTAGATVTRAADVASITGANFSSWYNNGQGSFSAEWRYVSPVSKNLFTTVLGVAGNGNNRFILAVGTASSSSLQKGTVAWSNLYSIFPGSYIENYVAYQNNASTNFFTNFIALTTYPQTMELGWQSAAGNWLNGTLARVSYWPTRLNDRALQYITQSSVTAINLYALNYAINGKDVLALNSVRNASTRDFIFIKGLLSAAQPRLTAAAATTSSGLTLVANALPKLAPSSNGNYFFASGLTLSGVTTRINGTNALSIATSPFSGSTATAPLLFRELRPQANWRITEPMPSGIIASPEFAIPFETNDFVLFMKAGQN